MKSVARIAIGFVMVGVVLASLWLVGSGWWRFFGQWSISPSDRAGVSIFATVLTGTAIAVGKAFDYCDWTENIRESLARRLHRPKPVPLGDLTKQMRKEDPERVRRFIS